MGTQGRTSSLVRVYRDIPHDFSDPSRARADRESWFSPTVSRQPTLAVLDLSDSLLSPSSLYELVVPLGQQVRGGTYGDLRIVIVTPDPATRELIALLARAHEIPLFVAWTSRPEDLDRAEPVGDLTANETDTLEDLSVAGGQITVSRLAQQAGIGATAANNRLVNLERKGYVYRIARHRRHGDLYVDPRAPMSLAIEQRPEPAPPRAALVAAGITSDPYDTSPLELDGAAAERAAEILRRRGKAE